MMDVVEPTDLRKEPSKRFVVAGAVVNGTRPVICPFDHRSRLEAVGPHFIDVTAVRAGNRGWPVAKGQEVPKLKKQKYLKQPPRVTTYLCYTVNA